MNKNGCWHTETLNAKLKEWPEEANERMKNWEKKSMKKRHAFCFRKEKSKPMKNKPSSHVCMQNGENRKNVINHAPTNTYTACSFTENSSENKLIINLYTLYYLSDIIEWKIIITNLCSKLIFLSVYMC